MLLAVTKTQPLEKMQEAKEAGLREFGENRVQELMDKYPQFNDINWHLIGICN